MKKQLFIGALLSLVSSSVYAHGGHTGHVFLAGFTHPFSGIDHVLVMLAIGLWAGKIGGAARWQLPLTFVVIMAISAMIGVGGMPSLEMGVAASVMAMGLLLVLSFPINRAIQLSLTAIFATLHGFAHGSELSFENGTQVLLGMVLATALLHGAGLLFASQQNKMSRLIHTALGWLTFLAGGYMLLAAS
ncbi:MAG: HupE/UreJ family protein [Methylotenera sp.]|nr:HupE/UreJ family protein [Methylococcaceae bacterium]MDP3818718.1 HupE/UreJ family protein [Methylotenera sp.]